jgi:hypothetical protein
MGDPRERSDRAATQNNQLQNTTQEPKLIDVSRRDLFHKAFKGLKRGVLLKPTDTAPEDIGSLNLNRRETVRAGVVGSVLLVPGLRRIVSDAKPSSRFAKTEAPNSQTNSPDNQQYQSAPVDENTSNDPHSAIEDEGHHET